MRESAWFVRHGLAVAGGKEPLFGDGPDGTASGYSFLCGRSMIARIASRGALP
jgi:hypothetical protein